MAIAPLDLCLDCGCALVGDERNFCQECFDEMFTVEDGMESRALYGAVPEDAAQEFVSEMNAAMNLVIDTLREMQAEMKDFAVKNDLLYLSYKDDPRYKKGDVKKDETKKDETKKDAKK